jgi:1-pyrroline-5-carboxylate dehydrogenase
MATMTSLTYHNIYAGVEAETGKAFEAALTAAREAPAEVPHRIAGETVTGGPLVDRPDPARPDQVASRHHEGDAAVVERAIAAARAAAPDWRQTPAGERAAALARTRDIIVDRRFALAALSALETGKPRGDAIAEVQECIALLELYLRQLEDDGALAVTMTAPAGGRADIYLKPYGVVGVIAPFNFPLAIPVTMSAAALLMGNTVVFKPSAITPACGDALASVFEAAGLPAGVFNTVHGSGATGELLSESDVDAIAFTGRADVGLQILARLGRPPYNRPLMAEMGGKNPTIVSGAASDLAVAARAVARSAYGMSGQKCNACSRVLVQRNVHDAFVNALVEEARELRIGDPMDPDSFCGPLVTGTAFDRYRAVVEEARASGATIAHGGGTPGGWYPEATVAAGLAPGHRLLRDELFVPFLAVRPFDDFGDALAEANDVRFGLAAGLFSDDEAEQDRFLDEIQAGIVFVNNPTGGTTGVWPGSQSMAGWKASASTGKGGFGPWYMAQFGREQSVSRFGTAA